MWHSINRHITLYNRKKLRKMTDKAIPQKFRVKIYICIGLFPVKLINFSLSVIPQIPIQINKHSHPETITVLNTDRESISTLKAVTTRFYYVSSSGKCSSLEVRSLEFCWYSKTLFWWIQRSFRVFWIVGQLFSRYCFF